jgi:hypothetical protein
MYGHSTIFPRSFRHNWGIYHTLGQDFTFHRVLFYQPSCHKCLHLAIFVKPITVNILLQHQKLTLIEICGSHVGITEDVKSPRMWRCIVGRVRPDVSKIIQRLHLQDHVVLELNTSKRMEISRQSTESHVSRGLITVWRWQAIIIA